MKCITKEIAERFLAEEFDIRNYVQIEDAAAEILAKYQWPLNLRGLTSLSEKAAKACPVKIISVKEI